MRDLCARPAPDTSTPACLRQVSPRRRPAVKAKHLPMRAPDLPRPLRQDCELASEAAVWEVEGAAAPAACGACTARGVEETAGEGGGWVVAGGGGGRAARAARAHCTLPRAGGAAARLYGGDAPPPRRCTPDGTHIFYWCDLPPRRRHELDDGACNPLWARRGFSQTFLLWKEGRRQVSAPLHASLTYVTLPWWAIAKDILDLREEPILTF